MDQVIEVARHSSSEGVHRKVHPFFHHLHLCDNVRWCHICDGRAAHILPFWFAQGVNTFQPLLISSLSTGAFLVLLLSVMPCVLLTQLLFQIMVLLSEAFRGSDKSLNLSLKGSCTWFNSLNVVGGHHRASKYHATLCPGSVRMAYKSLSANRSHKRHQLMMPKNQQ